MHFLKNCKIVIKKNNYKILKTYLLKTTNFHFLCAIILSKQTLDTSVNKYTFDFLKNKTAIDIYNFSIEKLKKEFKKINFYISKSITIKELAKFLIKNNINLENDILNSNQINQILNIKGIGIKTINVFINNIYKINCIGVDTHVAKITQIILKLNKKPNPLKLSDFFKSHNLPNEIHKIFVFIGKNTCQFCKKHLLNKNYKFNINYSNHKLFCYSLFNLIQ